MKLKCKKIKGIEKTVCVAEQKIAYNYFFLNSPNPFPFLGPSSV